MDIRKTQQIKIAFIIDEVPAQVVRDIYRWYVEDGMSKIGIVRHLNELGRTYTYGLQTQSRLEPQKHLIKQRMTVCGASQR